jgi:anaerobic ribonucleoside-triphosphate reductase activating protein
MKLNINQEHYPLTALGPGRRLGIWLQGCHLACPGCMSRHTWEPTGGIATDVYDLLQHWRTALEDGADGLTVSGGEPFEQAIGLGHLLHDAAELRDQIRPEADILVYTGFSEAVALRRGPQAVAATDALVIGRYLKTAPTRLIWRGSSNQRLIPRTDRGRRRYKKFINREVSAAPLQIDMINGDLRVIGVPLADDLRRLQAALASAGLTLNHTTWESSLTEEYESHD